MSAADFEALFQAGVAHQRAGRWSAAVEAYEAAGRLRMTTNLAANLAQAFKELGEFDQAAAFAGAVVRNRPDDPMAQAQLAAIHGLRGKVDLAEAAYGAALALDPDNPGLRFDLGALYLSAHRFAQGWPLYEERLRIWPDQCAPPRGATFPEWRGEPLVGRSILVWREQGLGDQILMARFIRTLKANGAAHVTFVCGPPLAEVFRGIEGVDAVIANDAEMSIPRHDYWIRCASMPLHLCASAAELSTAPYIRAPTDRGLAVRGSIGLIWRGNPKNPVDAHRSLRPSEAARLLDMGMVSLHPEETGARDFADTAAIIDRLDLVVCVDTSVAHLAGAMGKPCWVMLPVLGTDWRWPRPGAAASDWYPTTKIYRQARVGDWSGVIDEIGQDLAGTLSPCGHRPE